MKFEHNFKKDLEILLSEVDNGEPFAFTRFADGEHAVLEGKHIQGYDWHMEPTYSKCRDQINAALDCRHPRYFYGISCSCCDAPKADYYKRRLSDCMDRVTFSNIFANGNYARAKHWLESIDTLNTLKQRGEPWLLVNDKAYNKDLPFTSDRIFFTSNVLTEFEQDPNWFDKVIDLDLLTHETNNLVLVAVGPMSEILVHYMWTRNPNNYYIDIGSIVDPYIHGSTRIYHHHPDWANLECKSL